MAYIKMLASIDVHIDSTVAQCLSTMELTVNIFVDIDTFIDDITSNISEIDSVILITSDLLGQNLSSITDSIPQLRSIYIYSTNVNQDVHWADECSKIGISRVFTNTNNLIAQLNEDLKQHNEVHLNNTFDRIFSSTPEKTPVINVCSNEKCSNSTRDLTGEKTTFLWLQVLNEILIDMPQLPTILDDMLNKCRSTCAADSKQLLLIEQFQNTYKPEDVINWYTQETFLYRLLNQALRTQDVNNIFQFRLVIIDLYRQLNQLFQSSMSSIQRHTVYRGQRMSYSEIQNLHSNTNGLISWNSFVSTTLHETRAKSFSQKAKPEERKETVAVVFALILDPEIARTTNKPFADISGQSRYASEAEVLLSIGTVFRLDKVEQLSSDTWNVTATMCTFLDDPQAKKLYDYARTEVRSRDRLTYSAYGKFLGLMSDFDNAVRFLNNLLTYASTYLQLNLADLATIHNDLAYVYRESGQQNEALEQYKIALHLEQNCVPIDEIRVAQAFSDMGWLLMTMRALKEAHDCHTLALKIRRKYSERNPGDLAMSLNCLGLVHVYSSELDSGKELLDEALEIRKACLPPLHPFIAMSYSSLGSYYHAIKNDDKALKMFEQALAIYESSLPPSHHLIAESHRDICWLSLKQKRWSKAIDSFKVALADNHPRISGIKRAIVYDGLAEAYRGLTNYQDALDNYEQALALAISFNNQKLISKLIKSIEEIEIYISSKQQQ